MSKVPYRSECRECDKPIRALIPGSVASNDSEGQRVRCSNCGTTNYIRNHETDGPISA